MTVSYVGRGESLSWVYGVDNVNIPNSDVVDSPFNDFTQFDNMDFSANYNSILSRENKSLITSFISEYNDKVKRLSADENYILTQKYISSLDEMCEEINKKLLYCHDSKVLKNVLDSTLQKQTEMSKYIVLLEGVPYRIEPRDIAADITNERINGAIELLNFVAKAYPKIAKESAKLQRSRPHANCSVETLNDYLEQLKKILSGKKLLSNRRQRSSSIHFKDAWGGGDKSGRINAQKNVEINKKMEGIYIGFTQRTIESQTENQSVVFKSSKHEMVENKLIYLASLANELSKLNDSISDENLKYSINKVVGEVLELKLKKIQKMAKSSKCNFSFSNLKKDLAMLSSLAVTGIAAGVIPTFIATGAVAAIAPILAALGCAIYAFNPQLKETETSKLLDASIKDIGATLGSELKDEKLGRFEYLRHKYAAYKYRKAAKHTFDG
ncbi:membrane protein [Yersinia pseudotuberculosis]|nr:membrane protein [Yersinia pseudotuberculosis]CFV22649.1 membrane protein [Yersinia pseudotuberculosis]CNB18243.1 membrane protein [Yersinia pseudotuberculosis]CNB26178.1 membrane protein [Yersinia pseudotuberculosis]CRY58040.1 membrane protein [Yersinia pseudotuberculosis]